PPHNPPMQSCRVGAARHFLSHSSSTCSFNPSQNPPLLHYPPPAMSTILLRIKRAVLSGNFELSEKARVEMYRDGLTEQDLIEVISTAQAINKAIRSTSPLRPRHRETLYVIISENFDHVTLYTKGKFVDDRGVMRYYFFVSAKCA